MCKNNKMDLKHWNLAIIYLSANNIVLYFVLGGPQNISKHVAHVKSIISVSAYKTLLPKTKFSILVQFYIYNLQINK